MEQNKIDFSYSIKKIKEVAYGFRRHSEASSMLRQLLEEREQLLKQIKLDNEKIKEYKVIISIDN